MSLKWTGLNQLPILKNTARYMVGRRLARAEAFPKGRVDLAGMRILVRVRTKYCENQYHRMGKGSLAM